MHRLIKRNEIKVGPEKAQEFLAINTLHKQRPLNERHVREIAEKIKSGLFRYGQFGIAVYPDGSKVLVNGQHQSAAVVREKCTIDGYLEVYEIDSPEDISVLFRQYDSSFTSRTLGQNSSIEADALGLDWATKCVGLVLAAAIFETKGAVSFSMDRRISLLKDFVIPGSFAKSIVFGEAKNPKFMMRRAVFAAMFRAYDRNRKDAEYFWTAIRDGEGLVKNDPQYLLREFLKESSVSRGRGASSSKELVTDHEIIYRCIQAWNLWRRQEHCKCIKYSTAYPVPKAI